MGFLHHVIQLEIKLKLENNDFLMFTLGQQANLMKNMLLNDNTQLEN